MSDVLAAYAGAEVETKAADLKEVDNYIVAMDYGIERLKSLPLSLRLIREIHEKLMHSVRGNAATPGKFRTSQNWICVAGCTLTTATYIPPSLDYMQDCLSELEKFLYNKALPPLVQVALIHYQFEAIHPFLDGNGRVGRLLITLFLIERGILPAPLLYLSAFFEAQYFLNGVSRQTEDVLMRATNINQLLEAWHEQTEKLSSPVSSKLIDQLTANSFITIKRAAEMMGVSYTTVQRALVKLEDLHIVQEISGSKRNRVYCAKQILTILDMPARINV